ncbi:interferon alpha-inducible protein 27-like protein 2 isoform X1 [Bubalus bubalis]|uniref:interferon alpha-inducible protein 27-like protein 2 isoform X1 n=2 Tax=Bubalus bubalis TaxID=89462 RepID=UPI001D12AE0B|nr:interferon alpha-inducible protein 27-like protein 2 isoform X1 [Bubalus bubalis]
MRWLDGITDSMDWCPWIQNQCSHIASRMSARAIESGEGYALGPLLPELLPEEEEEPSQSTNQASDGSSPGKAPQGPHQGPDGSGSDPTDPPKSKGSNFYHYAGKTAAAVIGGALAVGSVPVVLGAMGFTGAGIAASSIAAKMMSAAAVANGGGVAAGSLVATLQSVGAAGLSTSSNILLGSAGAKIGAWMWGSKKKAPSPPGSSTEEESGSHAGDDPPGPQGVSPPNDKPSASQNSSKNHKK